MNQYYLISQLPGLDGLDAKSPLPIGVEEFKEVCSRNLSGKSMKILENLTIAPARDVGPSGSALVDAWNQEERMLRLALGTVRAARMKKNFELDNEVIPPQIAQAARTATEMGDPLSAEIYLCNYRLESLNRLRPMDSFCEDAVYFYGLKLMLLERMQKFDQTKGIASYRKIYSSIINGDRNITNA